MTDSIFLFVSRDGNTQKAFSPSLNSHSPFHERRGNFFHDTIFLGKPPPAFTWKYLTDSSPMCGVIEGEKWPPPSSKPSLEESQILHSGRTRRNAKQEFFFQSIS